jgi:hypothetical protein
LDFGKTYNPGERRARFPTIIRILFFTDLMFVGFDIGGGQALWGERLTIGLGKPDYKIFQVSQIAAQSCSCDRLEKRGENPFLPLNPD